MLVVVQWFFPLLKKVSKFIVMVNSFLKLYRFTVECGNVKMIISFQTFLHSWTRKGTVGIYFHNMSILQSNDMGKQEINCSVLRKYVYYIFVSLVFLINTIYKKGELNICRKE